MTLRYHTPLSPEEQRALGLDRPRPMAIADRVRFAELDVLNHVNNKAYMTWFETLRVRYFDELCMPHLPAGTPRPRTVLRSAEIRYLAEVLPNEDYVATCEVRAFRSSSYTLDQTIWSGGVLRCTYGCVMVTLAADGSGKVALPQALRALWVARDGARQDADPT